MNGHFKFTRPLIRVSNRNSVMRNCAKLSATVLESRAIARNCAQFQNSCSQFRAIERNGIAIGNPNHRASKFKMTVHKISSDPPFSE